MNDLVHLQNQLTGALIGLARATDGNEHLINTTATAVVIESLAATRPEANADRPALEKLLGRVEDEKRNMVPDCFLCACPCGRTNAYDLAKLGEADIEIRKLKFRILAAVRRLAAADHPKIHEQLFYKALIVIGMDDFGIDLLLPIVQEAEEAADSVS